MFFVRFLLLAFLVAYSFSMGQIPPSGLNAFGKVAAFSFFIAAPALYLLPTYEAWKNQHPNLTAIALVNIFLGWSLLGWVVAVVWAYKKPEPTIPIAPPPAQEPAPSPPPQQQQRETKKCPFCAEDVLVQAIKCKHCGSTLTAQT
jgi:hypothetical protein